jgi:lipooligosaccharide transport system permease protein
MELVLRQYDYWATVYRRTWRGTVVTSFLVPLLFLAAFGVGLGGFVDDGSSSQSLDGLTYLAFIAPGLLASTAMQIGIEEATWPVMGAIKWQRIYFGQIATPLRVVDILNAHLAFIAFRLVTTCSVFVVVIALFGTVTSVAGGIAALLISVLVGMAHATPMFAGTATMKSESGFSLIFRLVVIPMSLFSGAFFPVSELPTVLQWVAYLTPMWHGVELTRMCTTGMLAWGPAVGDLAYLTLWVVAGWWFARRQLHWRLVEKL